MFSLSTPSRVGRGLIVPGIDTKPYDNTSSALSYGGLHTPPQSAHESRRPSLQYSAIPEAPYSATPSTFAYSQPTTPVHSIHHSNSGFIHAWSDNPHAHNDVMTGLKDSCSVSQMSEQALDAVFKHQPGCDTNAAYGMPSYPHCTPTGNIDTFSLHNSSALSSTAIWTSSQQVSNRFAAQTTCLGSALFPMSQSLSSELNRSGLPSDDSSSPQYGADSSVNGSMVGGLHNYIAAPNAVYHRPQVVVPSQLSPHDNYTQHHFNDFIHQDQGPDALSNSFASSSTTFNDYEVLGPPSPMEAYFDHSDDDEYLKVKAEEASNIDYAVSSRRSSTRTGNSHNLRRRSSKRLRSGEKHPWHTHDFGDPQGAIEVQCVGKRFRLDKPVKREAASSLKPHQCLFIKPDGQPCGFRFDRSEHLKRHMGKHSDKKDYPCPLCTRRIQRPDNAGDHFKTHLRPKAKGKRNDHFDWATLSQAIWDEYTDKKKAKKLLDNLRRWVDAGMPDTTGSKRL